ncbi:MAG TPA: hypothetical protein VL475_05975 [Planctomycetaceae bacterium]|jgi:hypothetical protein|nr:hypothetical protein [Planctomycetaceae bacterium]
MSLNWLKHAFAIEPAKVLPPTERERALVDRLCRETVARDLATPALLFLETLRPLNYVSGQALRFFTPLLSAFGEPAAYDELAAFLERRDSIDHLCRRMEELDRERSTGAPDESSQPDDRG